MILCDYGSCSGEVKKDVEAADTEEADNSEKFKRFNDQMYVYLGAAPTTLASTWSAPPLPSSSSIAVEVRSGCGGGCGGAHAISANFIYS